MIVIDTNVISELFRPVPEPQVLTWLQKVSDETAITSITLAELRAGILGLPDGKRKESLHTAVEEVIQQYRDTKSILSFDEPAATAYAEITVHRLRLGQPISMADAQIAAICRAESATCATRNTKDFAYTGVTVLDPWLSVEL